MPKTRRLYSKSLKGGKLIGEGAYGCVYQPAIRCEGNSGKKRNASIVSKLLYKKNAEKEYAIKDLLKPIDPDQKYLLYPIKSCAPSTKPDNASDTTLLWYSSDSTIATIDSTGTFTGISPGTVTITVTDSKGLISTLNR